MTHARAESVASSFGAAFDHDDVRTIGEALAWGRERGRSPDAACLHVESEAQAFAIQRAVAERLVDTPRGWKSAGVGVDGLRLIAPILGKSIMPSPAIVTAAPELPLRLEVEFGLCVLNDIGERQLEGCDDGLRLIGEVFVAYELCCHRLPEAAPPRLFLADGLANAGLVVGGGVVIDRQFRFEGRRVRLTRNGETVVELTTGASAEKTSDAFLWLARQISVHGGLRAGDVVITGSLTGSMPLSPGDEVHAVIEGIGEASLRFDPSQLP